ncbi:MAG: creatininase family protein [Candidatus Latescibacterota bacterium]
MSKPWRLQEITYKEVKEQKYEVAVLPIGSTEPHALHMPYGSDAFEAGMLADSACERAHLEGASVILLPTVPYGVNRNLLGYPLTMNVDQSTLDAVVGDLLASLEHHGIRKVVLFNGHGGNEFKGLLRTLYGRTKVFVTLVDWWKVAGDEHDAVFEASGDHADEMETSVSLALFEELVRMEDMDDGAVHPTRFEAINQGWAQISRPWHLLTRSAGVGDPRKATKEKGEQYIELTVARMARFIKELSDAQMDETFPFCTEWDG